MFVKIGYGYAMIYYIHLPVTRIIEVNSSKIKSFLTIAMFF